MNAQQAVNEASSRIDRRDAETLLLYVMGRDRAWLRAHPEAELAATEIASFFAHVSRRADHWPLQYLTGQQEFFGLPLHISRDVLIPRPETELLVEAVIDWARRISAANGSDTPLQIVDIGTGSGAIALALAANLPNAHVDALDLSPLVRPVVEGNAHRLGLQNRVAFRESDLLAALSPEILQGKRFDVVASNPPYVPVGEAPTMQPEVRDFEPHLALFAGSDGLAIYRRLIPQAWEALRPGGLLALEIGYGQEPAIRQLLAGWNDVLFKEDYAGIARIALAIRPKT